jgi:hypothetical protein
MSRTVDLVFINKIEVQIWFEIKFILVIEQVRFLFLEF